MTIVSLAEGSIAAEVAGRIAELIQNKLRTRPAFNLVLTGGTLGIQTVAELGKLDLDSRRVRIWFGDERFVSLDHQDRNEHQALEVWPNLQNFQFTRFPSPADGDLSECAESHSDLMESEFGALDDPETAFDLVLLGMGPDGHVASLFPGRSHGESWVVAEPDSPKPPSERLSFSYQALSRSDRVWFIVSGAAKLDATKQALAGEDIPAAKVVGVQETVWFVSTEISDAL